MLHPFYISNCVEDIQSYYPCLQVMDYLLGLIYLFVRWDFGLIYSDSSFIAFVNEVNFVKIMIS